MAHTMDKFNAETDYSEVHCLRHKKNLFTIDMQKNNVTT